MRRHRLDRPGTAPMAWIALVLLLAASVIAQFGVGAEAHFDIERWPGGMALFGVAAAAAGVLAAWLLGRLLGRRDDYYDDDGR
jgi:hypothetical protein